MNQIDYSILSTVSVVTQKHVFLELMWLSPVAAWINILSMFLIFCIVLWVIDQYQGGLGLPIQENIDLLSEELKLKLLIVSFIEYGPYYMGQSDFS